MLSREIENTTYLSRLSKKYLNLTHRWDEKYPQINALAKSSALFTLTE